MLLRKLSILTEEWPILTSKWPFPYLPRPGRLQYVLTQKCHFQWFCWNYTLCHFFPQIWDYSLAESVHFGHLTSFWREMAFWQEMANLAVKWPFLAYNMRFSLVLTVKTHGFDRQNHGFWPCFGPQKHEFWPDFGFILADSLDFGLILTWFWPDFGLVGPVIHRTR